MKSMRNFLMPGLLISLNLLSAGLAASSQAPLQRFPASAGGQGDGLYARRLALLVGANKGGPDRAVLRYAVADARAVGKVLEDMGGVLIGDGRYLEDPDKAALLEAIRSLAADVERARRTSRRVEVIFYYSGHSDEESLFLGEEKVSYAELKDLINALRRRPDRHPRFLRFGRADPAQGGHQAAAVPDGHRLRHEGLRLRRLELGQRSRPGVGPAGAVLLHPQPHLRDAGAPPT